MIGRLGVVGFALIGIGIALIVAGSLLAVLHPLSGARGAGVGVGGCVVIFFVPICFGAGPGSGQLMVIAMILAAVLIALAIALFLLPYLLLRRSAVELGA